MGSVERGMFKWCAEVRKVSRHGMILSEDKKCFAHKDAAIAYMQGAVQGHAASFGHRKPKKRIPKDDKYEVLRHIRKPVPHRPTRAYEDKRKKRNKRDWQRENV